MKRKLVTAVAAASVLLGGGAAVAFADGDSSTGAAQAPAAEARTAARAGDADKATTASKTGAKAGVTEAIAAALAHTPGTAVSADREDDGQGAGTWQVDVVKADGAEYAVTVSPDTGKVLGAHRDTDDDGDDDGRADLAALKGTTVDAREAVRAVAAKGTVSDVDLDDDAGAGVWSVDTAGGGEWLVDARTGKVTQDLDD